MSNPREDAYIPERPSDCAACVALSEEDAEHPYLSIFYSVVLGTIYFFGIPVTGTRKDKDENDLLVYEGVSTDPDLALPLATGALTSSGAMSVDADPEVYLTSEAEALNYIAILRAIYQMREELVK